MKKPRKAKALQKSKSRIIIAVAGLIIAAALITPLLKKNSPQPKEKLSELEVRLAGFAGSEACAKCHQQEYNTWKNSTHAKAGGIPGKVNVIAAFDGKPLQFKDAVVTPIKRGADYIFQIARNGQQVQEIKVDAVIGGGHMIGGGTQSFFQKFSDGTVRFLPFDFIKQENLWFVQLRRDNSWIPVSANISLDEDLANWPPHRALGTLAEMSNCQNCHGSQIAVEYNASKFRYETHYTTLQINCESCHGPGKRHIELVSQPGWEQKQDIGMIPLATLAKDGSLNVCFQCHAEKKTLTGKPYLPGDKLEDHFSLKFPVMDGVFHADGRVRSFGYQSSHLYSDCYINGSMTCVDCHEPHGQGYRDVFGKALVGRFDNGQCTSCHASKALSPEKHSHHLADSPGNLCTSCHMPFLQHQGVGPHLKFSRSDHAIPIPRPSFDSSIGIENACQKCHGDKPLEWQQAKVQEWYGEIKPHHPAIINLLEGQNGSATREASKDFLLENAQSHPMAQIGLLANYIQRYMFPNANLGHADLELLTKYAADSDVDIRALAYTALQLGADNLTLPDLGQYKTNRAFLNRWSLLADEFGTAYAALGNFPTALKAFNSALTANPSNEVAMSHLALTYFQSGDVEKTINWLKEAIKVKPHQAVLHFQLAQTMAQAGDNNGAISSLKEGLKYSPSDAKAKAMLENLQSR